MAEFLTRCMGQEGKKLEIKCIGKRLSTVVDPGG